MNAPHTPTPQAGATHKASRGILFILIGVMAISINDLLIKTLSGGYPLHQIVFTRAFIGIIISIGLVQFEGGWRILATKTPGLHALRGVLVIVANMTFYAAVAVMPLAQVTALFFVAPLFITLLSIPILGEKVGPMRMGAVVVGLLGVIVMQQPWASQSVAPQPMATGKIVALLPVAAALTYALMQVLTRKLGTNAKASAMAVYIQGMFLLVSGLMYLVAGDGRFAEGSTDPSVVFLLRAWVWPAPEDWATLLALGICSGVVGYCLSAAYRMANAATIAPYEYVGLPLAIVWGWVFFAEWPDLPTWVGCALIVGAGVFVFLREQHQTPGPRGWRRRAMRR